ncbi:hypothetical protein CASFOL_039704 [Castilleja foliolosa]|uniref:Uncharacterized protein n=1 Tax=Castilleja foliolosa TaxID=1961234 RepID=A0ABD3BGD4_9LAMI
MFGFTRTKRVTDPLDDEAKARIVGRGRIGPDYVNSVSESSPDPADDDVTTSSSLSEFFYGFDDAVESLPDIGDPADCGRDPSIRDSGGDAVDLIKSIVQIMSQRDAFGNLLAAHVKKAVQVFAPRVGSYKNKEIVRRNVMAYLRNCGYDAAICNTKWESCGGLSAGGYEFIDVLRPARYIVDLDFAAEFEIARPTECYERLMQHLPAIFVGTIDDLKQILKVASDAARRSLKSGGLHMPPWRKHRFMQNKWVGPYRRAGNVFPVSVLTASSSVKKGHGVKCRAVGFDAAVNRGGLFLFPAIARTR